MRKEKRKTFIGRGEALSSTEKELIHELYLHLSQFLTHLAFKMLQNDKHAEEAVAITFEKIIKNSDKISSISHSRRRPYCVTILKNVCKDMMKNGSREVLHNEIYLFKSHDEAFSHSEFLDQIESEALLLALKSLNENEQVLIRLRYAHEMSYLEIGRLLNISEEAARKRNQRILEKLKLHMTRSE